MKTSRILFFTLICLLGALLIIKPEICKIGVAEGIILSGNVIIPSLFPFSVCMLYIIKSGFTDKFKFISPVTLKILGVNSFCFFLFLFSLLGGYPIGAKLINEAIENKALTAEEGRKMLNFCVNAGPAFIVSAVGNALLGSNKLGYILLASHISASFLICRFLGKNISNADSRQKILPAAENFVAAASDSATAVMGICGFVILFSSVTEYLDYFSLKYDFLTPLIYISEVTNGVTKTHNIYLISFLLGFSGISIWCQVMSVSKSVNINIFSFIMYRIIHGLLSLFFTFILLKIFPVTLPAFSNTDNITPSVSGIALSLSIIIMGIVFIISLSNRKESPKILEEFA